MTLNTNTLQMVARVRIGVMPDSDDQFYGFCPDLGCIHVAADTEEEALRLAVEAVASYLDMSIKHGDPIPIGVIEQKPNVAENMSLEKTTAASSGSSIQRATKSFVENVPVALGA